VFTDGDGCDFSIFAGYVSPVKLIYALLNIEHFVVVLITETTLSTWIIVGMFQYLHSR